MRARSVSRATIAVAALVVLLYGWRMAEGWVGGLSYAWGSSRAARGHYGLALPHLDRAAVGFNRAAVLWTRGEVLYGLWQVDYGLDGRTPETDALLRRAYEDYTEAISLSPASGWYWSSVGALYEEWERQHWADEGLPLGLFGEGAWGAVGRPGRVAIGLTRVGIEREPTVYRLRDALTLVLHEFQLDELAQQSVRESAAVLPIYTRHVYRELEPTPPEFLDAFAEGSREAFGDTPLLRHSVHLSELGKIELRRGNPVQAEQDLRASLEYPSNALNRAEVHYHLGVALMEQGRHDAAIEALKEAELHPVMEASAIRMQARLAERGGRLDDALAHLRRVRRLQPREMQAILDFARLARRLEKWDQAEEALKWASIIYPDDPRPYAELTRTYRDEGDNVAAARALREVERRGGDMELATPGEESPASEDSAAESGRRPE
jgi:tetratricopeptide (TPR) repeat protein